MHKTIKDILKREKVTAEKAAAWCKISATSFRRMLRGEINMDVDIFNQVLTEIGYKILIVKNQDVV